MLSALAIAVLSQFITGSSAFTRVPYNTPLGYGLANRQLPLGTYWVIPPGIASPKVITVPRPLDAQPIAEPRRVYEPMSAAQLKLLDPEEIPPVEEPEGWDGRVIDFDSRLKQITLKIPDGSIKVLNYNRQTRWTSTSGKELAIYVGKTQLFFGDDNRIVIQDK